MTEWIPLFSLFGLVGLITICITICSVISSSNERKRAESRHKMCLEVDKARYEYLTAMKLVDQSEIDAKDLSMEALEVE